MDNSVGDPSKGRSWATPIPASAALIVGGVVLLSAAILAAADAVGLVMMGIAGILLVGFGVHSLLMRPRLAIADDSAPELRIRTIGGTHRYRIDQIQRIRLLQMRRVGRRVGQLEVDVVPEGATDPDDSRLFVFSRWDLGADLLDVADQLTAAGFRVDDARG